MWAPDGERIAFVSGQWDVFVISSRGGKPKRLTDHSATYVTVSWSQDGKWIYFPSDRSGKRQIWKMPSGGGEARQVTRQGAIFALESLDRRWLYYTKGDNGSVWKVPADGGTETQVIESVVSEMFAVVSEGIYFIGRPNTSGNNFIEFFNFATKKIWPLSAIKHLDTTLSVSPDGRWILYSQDDQVGSDLMLVENFQ